jgi:multiple antibiotic resistance protein
MEALALRTFLTLFVIIDPVGIAPLFLGLTADREKAERRRLARRGVLVAGGVLFGFALAGSALIQTLGISLDSFRVAGGILLFRIAMDMVLGQHERETAAEEKEARAKRDISIFPLAIPLIAGPGALASIMILAGEARAHRLGLVMVLAMCALVLGLAWGALQMADGVARVLGRTGVNVVTRVLGILLAALAVQYVADGGRGLLGSALR